MRKFKAGKLLRPDFGHIILNYFLHVWVINLELSKVSPLFLLE